MKQFRYLFLLPLFVMFVVSGCGGGGTNLQNTDECEKPIWVDKKPEDPNFLYEVASGTSQDMQVAVDKAMASCRSQLSLTLTAKLNVLGKSFVEEIGQDENSKLSNFWSNTSTQVASNTVSGAKEKERFVCKDGNKWRAYALLEYPIGAANKALLDALKQNEEAYTRFRSSESFNELEKEVEKLNKK